MRLEARVTLWLLILLGSAAVVTLVFIGWAQSRAVAEHAQETARLIAESLEATLEVGMLNNSPEDIEVALDNAAESHLMEQVAVYGRDGDVWVASDPTAYMEPEHAEVLKDAMFDGRPASVASGNSLSIYIPVDNKDSCKQCHSRDARILGAVGVTVDEEPLRHELSEGTRNSFLLALIPLALGMGVAVWGIRRDVLRPLARLGDAAGKLAAGDLSTRVPSPLGSAEFQAVGETLNEMAAKLERRAKNLDATVEQLRLDLEGLEDLQTMLGAGAGMREVLSRTAAHLGSALAASGVGIWRVGGEEFEAEWGLSLPPVADIDLAEDGRARSSAGPLGEVDEATPIEWVSVPAKRGDRTFAVVAVSWMPSRPLPQAERDLLRSLSGLVSIAVENAELLERHKADEESLEGLIRKTINAQEEERRRVARELHDETSQVLHGVMMNMDYLETLVGESGVSDELRERMHAVKALAEQAGKNLDKVMFDLRPALLDELGLVPALRWSLSQTREAFGIDIDFDPGDVGRMSEGLEMVAFRIVQEAVANAVKHAQAEHVKVSVETTDGSLRIEVADDGVGFDAVDARRRARTGEAAGLLGMRERAELLGGSLQVRSNRGQGTTVLAEIPRGDDDEH